MTVGCASSGTKIDTTVCARCGMKRHKGHTCPDRDAFPVCVCGHYSHVHVNELDWCEVKKCGCRRFDQWTLAKVSR